MRLNSQMHAIIGVCAAAAFVVTGFLAWYEVGRVHDLEVQAQGETMAVFLARACAQAMRGPSPREDLEALLKTSPQPEQGPPVASADVYDVRAGTMIAGEGATSRAVDPSELSARLPELREGRVLVREVDPAERRTKQGDPLLECIAPIVEGDEIIGVLHFTLTRRQTASSALTTTITIVLGAAVGVALLWVMLYKMINGRILKPLLAISQAITRVRAGDVTARVDVPRRDELGLLAESFNELVGILVERDSLAQRLEEANRLAEAHRRLNDAHRQLKEAQEQLILNEKHASLGRLVHGLNHELNNPLSAARNMIPPLEAALRTLQQSLDGKLEPAPPPAVEPAEPAPPLPPTTSARLALASTTPPTRESLEESLEDATEATSVIARSVQRAINIVRDLGGFSKLGTADLEEVDLRAIIDEAVSACAAELGPADRVQVTVDFDQPIKLRAFPSLLTQVFVNLVTNSAQAIEGQGKVKITARLLPAKDRVRIEVEDTGVGIPKENLSKVFEPFFTTKAPGRGTGLGLAICMGCVEKHGGTIEALKRRRGACFVVELPREAQVKPSDPRQSASLFSGSTILLPPK